MPLPPANYGGVERVVLWLSTALRDLGHQVWVGALEGSMLSPGVELIPISSDHRSAGDLVRKLPPGVDIVHFQAPPEEEFFKLSQIPNLTTIHGNGQPDEIFPQNSVFLSQDHATRHGRQTFVYNGVDPTEFRLSNRKKKSAPLYLSKTGLRSKNLRGALQIANHGELELTIAGGYRPLHILAKTFFSRHHWIGSVSGELKAKLLGEASALLFPVIWNEPFGLVMVEAMLSGTPVVGSRLGSIPEVLGDFGGAVLEPLPGLGNRAKRGGIDAALDQWVQALREVESIDPSFLRKKAIERYSNHKMAQNYVEVYQRILSGEVLK